VTLELTTELIQLLPEAEISFGKVDRSRGLRDIVLGVGTTTELIYERREECETRLGAASYQVYLLSPARSLSSYKHSCLV
jgi:hypothetical protein